MSMAIPQCCAQWSLLFEGRENLTGASVILQQFSDCSPVHVFIVQGCGGFTIAEDCPFGDAIEIALEAVRRGARLVIEIGGGV